MSRHVFRAGALVAFATFAVAGASPEFLSIGSEVTLTPPESVDLGAKKPKVKALYVGPVVAAKGNPKLKLKVVASSSDSLTAVVKKAKGSGTFEVEVTPKGGEGFVIANVFELPPQPLTVDTASIAPGAELTVSGSYFGSKKPAVFVGGKKAKTLSFSDTEIHVRTHKKTPPGAADVVVKTKVGEGTLADGVEVGDGGGGPGDTTQSIRFRTVGDYRTSFSADATSISGRRLIPIGFSFGGSSQGRVIEALDVVVEFDLATVAGRPSVDLVAADGDACTFTVTDSSIHRYSLDPSGNGTSASVKIVSWDSETRRLDVDIDADLLDVDSGNRISIRAAKAVVVLSDPS